MNKLVQENGPTKKATVNVLSYKIDFKSKLIKEVEEDTRYSSKKKSTKRILQFLTSMYPTKEYPSS